MCMQAIDALAEVFIVALLPDRRLLGWEERSLPAEPPVSKDDRRRLLYWHLEDCIKVR